MIDDLSGLEQTVEAMAQEARDRRSNRASGEVHGSLAEAQLRRALSTGQVVRASKLAEAQAALGERWFVWKGELQEAQGRAHRAEVEAKYFREQNDGLYLAIQLGAAEQESLRAEIDRLKNEHPPCICPHGFGQVVAENCPRCNPKPQHTISGVSEGFSDIWREQRQEET